MKNKGVYRKKFPLIAIEGIDGSGKSTVANLIAEKMNGVCIHTPAKDYDVLKPFFKNCELSAVPRFYFFLSSIWDAYNRAVELRNSMPVIFDRYILSTLIYHRVMFRKCGICFNVDLVAMTGFPPKADCDIVLKIDNNTALTRISVRDNSRTDLEFELDRRFQMQVQEEMLDEADIIFDSGLLSAEVIAKKAIEKINSFY